MVDATADTRVYRARFEKGFVRYTWLEVGDGKSGYFVAEYPDGSKGFFGSDQSGAEVSNARVERPDGGVFRYHLVESTNRLGQRVKYHYTQSNGTALLDEVAYVFAGGDTAKYSVRFLYEDRNDVVSTCVPGFELRLSNRMKEIRVFSSGTQIRRYALSYEPYSTSGGFSRLAAVQQYFAVDLLSDLAVSGTPDGQINAADAWLSHADATGILSLSEGDPSDPERLLKASVARLLSQPGTVLLHGDHLGTTVLATNTAPRSHHRPLDQS